MSQASEKKHVSPKGTTTMLDPAAKEFVTQAQQHRAQANADAQAKPSRETKLRPHETHRKPRTMNITFPTPAWPTALRVLAKGWGLRPADLVTWCVSYAIDAIMQEQVEAPSGKGREQHHRAGEWMPLPWEPREDTQ